MEKLTTTRLINFGLIQTQPTQAADTTTVIVAGLPRSGTSMISAVLVALGVFMGKEIDTAVFEDREFAAALAASGSEPLRQLIAARNAEHQRWGFKRPGPEALRQLDVLCRACRNPRLIVTFRDILAIAERNNISMQMDPLKTLPKLADQYRNLVATIGRLAAPSLLISYEKALQFPVEAVTRIASFCGLQATEEQIKSAAEVVRNGTPRYVHATRLEYHGFIGRLIEGQLRGWVKARQRDDIRVNVELELDGAVVQKACADQYRPDVRAAGFGDGRYGFSFPIDAGMKRDSIVNVRIENSDIVLNRSGLPLSKYEGEAS